MTRGRFFATDDLNLQGHHLVDWRWLNDIPTDDASANMALVYDGENVLWADLESGEFVAVDWDDIANKPDVYPPEDHTHPWDEVTGKPTFVNSITGTGGVEVSSTTGNVVVGLTDNVKQALDFFVGSVLGQPVVTVASDGVDISLTLTGTPDVLVLLFNRDGEGPEDFDTSGSPSVVLTEGTDAVPVMNYIWIPSDTQVLTTGAAWPTNVDYIPLATVYCQSAASAQTYGVYKVHAWTDHTHTPDRQGHLGHLNAWIRTQPATWRSGVAITPTLGAAQFDIALTGGVVLQLHDHAFPAMTTVGGSEPIYIINDPVTPFERVANLSAELLDSTGGALSNRYYSTVIWGVVSEDATDCKMYANLPAGSYNSAAGAQADTSGHADYGIPIEFAGTGFLIARLVVRHQSAGSTFTLVESIDLRGTFPGGFSGSSAGSGDHGALIGLSDPDHPLTALQQTGATTDQAVVWNGTTWVPDDIVNSVAAGTNISVSAAVGDITVGVVANPSFDSVGVGRAISATYVEAVSGQVLINSGNLNQALLLESTDANCNVKLMDTGGYGLLTTSGSNLYLSPNGVIAFGAFLDLSIRGYGNMRVDDIMAIGGAVSTTGTDRLKAYGDVRVTGDLFVDDIVADSITATQVTAKWLEVQDIGGNSPTLNYVDSAGDRRFWLYMPTSAPNVLRMAVNNGGGAPWDYDLMVWDNANNRVGIGNASPSYTLDVTGDARVTGSLGVARTVSSTYELAVDGSVSAGTYFVGATLLDVGDLGGSGFATGEIPVWNATNTKFEPGAGGGGPEVKTYVFPATLGLNSTVVPVTLFNITDLTKNAVYSVRFFLKTAANGIPDIRLHQNMSTGVELVCALPNATGAVELAWTTGFDHRINGAGTGNIRYFNINGILTTGGTGTTASISWAQNTSNAATSIMYENSYLILTRVDV